MVDRLATAPDIPPRQHNALLLAAGFAPEWRQRDLTAPDLAEVTSALDYMLAQQEPYPAVVLDRHWNLLKSNAGAVRLVEFLVGPIAPGTPINLADALVAPDVPRPHLTNWAEVVRHFIRSVETDAAADGLIETAALLERLLAYEGVRTALNPGSNHAYTGPVLATHFRKQDTSFACSPPLPHWGRPRTLHCRSCASSASLLWMMRRQSFCEAGARRPRRVASVRNFAQNTSGFTSRCRDSLGLSSSIQTWGLVARATCSSAMSTSRNRVGELSVTFGVKVLSDSRLRDAYAERLQSNKKQL
jgi:hypothetical protein